MIRTLARRGLTLAASASIVAVGFAGAPTPAQAVGPFGAGEVSGTVVSSPGVPLTGCSPQTFTFSSVVLNGTITDGARTMAGSVTTANVNGGGSCEGTTGGGWINPGATFQGSSPTGNVSGGFGGSYTRVGTHVIVNLSATMTLCDGANGCATYSNVPIALDASEFIPTKVDPATGAIQEANFTGEFHVGLPA